MRAALLAGVAFPLGLAASGQEEPVTTSEAAVEEDLKQQTVVVTGIRQSLKAAADLKRNDSRIVDAIVAEDIGKLPDQNIAEALQHITGVSISSEFGIGESVSIRGLSQNRVELNGRSTIGDDRDGISLEDFSSSFLKTVEVVKTPTADMIEGALKRHNAYDFRYGFRIVNTVVNLRLHIRRTYAALLNLFAHRFSSEINAQ